MLKIDIDYIRGILFMRLDGSLNNKTYYILENAINDTICKAGIRYALINLEDVNYINNNGINIIKNINNLINNGKLFVCGNNKLKDKNICYVENEICALNIINL